MSKKVFNCSSEFPYHVTARCINKEWFCSQEIAWKIFSDQLWFVSQAFNFRIHSFVLMPNHFHLIVHCPEANLSEGMRWFMTETSRAITRVSNRINETYGARFHRSLISDPHYYSHCYKYVYHNPVKANLVRSVEEYKYSSIQFILGRQPLEFPVFDSLILDSDNIDSALHWLNVRPNENNWLQIQKAVKKPTFQISKINSRNSKLESCRL